MAKVNGRPQMSYAELSELRDRVDAARVEVKAADKQTLQAKLEELVAGPVLRLGRTGHGKRGPKNGSLKGSKVAVKYRNPENGVRDLDGRGRSPSGCYKRASAGAKIEDYAV